ncbi:Adiponectin receptor protein 1 [Entophlyctis luteolus]|nr:Adiponectin receptor protein 1 [Entophlyctis luteolus]
MSNGHSQLADAAATTDGVATIAIEDATDVRHIYSTADTMVSLDDESSTTAKKAASDRSVSSRSAGSKTRPPLIRPSLLKRDAMPGWYQEEKFIWGGYRPIMDSTRECLYSLTYLHNETGNIWTHFIGFLLFVGLMGYTWGHLLVEPAFTGVDWRDHLIAFEL